MSGYSSDKICIFSDVTMSGSSRDSSLCQCKDCPAGPGQQYCSTQRDGQDWETDWGRLDLFIAEIGWQVSMAFIEMVWNYIDN